MKTINVVINDDEQLIYDEVSNSYTITKNSVIENEERKAQLKKDIIEDILKLRKKYEGRIIRKYEVDINITFEAVKRLNNYPGGQKERYVACEYSVNIIDGEKKIM